MKEIKIALSGEKEEQIAQHIMKSVYGLVREKYRLLLLMTTSSRTKSLR